MGSCNVEERFTFSSSSWSDDLSDYKKNTKKTRSAIKKSELTTIL